MPPKLGMISFKLVFHSGNAYVCLHSQLKSFTPGNRECIACDQVWCASTLHSPNDSAYPQSSSVTYSGFIRLEGRDEVPHSSAGSCFTLSILTAETFEFKVGIVPIFPNAACKAVILVFRSRNSPISSINVCFACTSRFISSHRPLFSVCQIAPIKFVYHLSRLRRTYMEIYNLTSLFLICHVCWMSIRKRDWLRCLGNTAKVLQCS